MMMPLDGGLNLEKLKWLRKMKSKKNWTELIFDSEIADLILRLEPTDVKRFNAFQDRFGSQWLNIITLVWSMRMEPMMMPLDGGLNLEKLKLLRKMKSKKNWTEPIFDSEIADLILRLEPTDVKRFNAFQDRFGSQWLNIITCKNLGLKLSNQHLRIAIGLRLGSEKCERLKCVCGKNVTEDGWHGLSCLKNAGRFSRYSNLNALIKQSLSSTHIPSVLEPRHLYRTDQERPDGLTLFPWPVGKQLLWDVTVVDSLALCRVNAGSVCNPGTAAAEAEERKFDKYKELVNDGYLFPPLAFEIQGAAGPSTENFLSKLCKNLSICTEEPRAGSFLK